MTLKDVPAKNNGTCAAAEPADLRCWQSPPSSKTFNLLLICFELYVSTVKLAHASLFLRKTLSSVTSISWKKYWWGILSLVYHQTYSQGSTPMAPHILYLYPVMPSKPPNKLPYCMVLAFLLFHFSFSVISLVVRFVTMK